MPHSRKHSGAWKETTPYRKVNGVWQPAQERFRKHSGVWKSAYSNVTPLWDFENGTVQGFTADRAGPNVDAQTHTVYSGSYALRGYDSSQGFNMKPGSFSLFKPEYFAFALAFSIQNGEAYTLSRLYMRDSNFTGTPIRAGFLSSSTPQYWQIYIAGTSNVQFQNSVYAFIEYVGPWPNYAVYCNGDYVGAFSTDHENFDSLTLQAKDGHEYFFDHFVYK